MCKYCKETYFERDRFVFYTGDPMSAFSAKGWVLAKPPPNVTNVTDQSLEDAIEVGAEEVEPDEENPECLRVRRMFLNLFRLRKLILIFGNDFLGRM